MPFKEFTVTAGRRKPKIRRAAIANRAKLLGRGSVVEGVAQLVAMALTGGIATATMAGKASTAGGEAGRLAAIESIAKGVISHAKEIHTR